MSDPICAVPGGQVAVQVCGFQIVDENGAQIPSNKRWLVGERVALKVQSVPPGRPLTSIEWWIPPETLATQSYTIPQGAVALPAPADLQTESIQFYFAAVPQATALTVTAVDSGKTFTQSLPIQVSAPTGVAITSTTASVNVGLDALQRLSLTFHDAKTGTVGIDVTGDCTPPDDGELAFLQLIKSYRSHSRFSGQVKVLDSHDDYWLDDVMKPLTQADVFTTNPPSTASASTANHVLQRDSPGNDLGADENVSVAWDFFKMYLMYKPNKPNAVWVTVGKLEWKWGGTAERGASGWTLTSSDQSTNPSGAASYELPVWSAAFRAHLDSDFKW